MATTLIVGVALPGATPSDVNPAALSEVSIEDTPAERRAFYEELARRWAPTFYQDTDDDHYVADFITNFDFDGDYNGRNNWENLEHRRTVPAYVYFAVSETLSHYFLNYSVFHPRDWHEWLIPDMHENDFEGVSLVLRKDGGYGRLVAMETLAHNRFSQYGDSGIETGTQDLEGPLSVESDGRPSVFIEAKGHGMYACDARCKSAPGGDGIVYYFADRADSPESGDGNYTRRYGYALIAMDSDGTHDGHQGFWYRRHDICNDCTFGSWGKLRGDNYGTDRANMPWVWHGGNRKPSRAGDMFCDPAFFFDAHLNGPEFDFGFSHQYVSHPFRTHTGPAGDLTAAFVFAADMAYRSQAARFGDTVRERSLCRPSGGAAGQRLSSSR